MSRGLRLLPVILLVWILIAFAWRLIQPNDPTIRSRLVNREVPAFALPAALPGATGLKSTDLRTGEPRLLNLFASWCVPCIGEVKVLQDLKARGVAIDGIAVRDRVEDVADFLARNGDPYERIGSDPQSGVQISLGSSGVPESFIVDGRGVIRYQHIGAIEPADVPLILAKLEDAK